MKSKEGRAAFASPAPTVEERNMPEVVPMDAAARRPDPSPVRLATSGGEEVTPQARARHAARIADALTDARNGNLGSAAFRVLGEKYGGGDEAGRAIRDALLSEGLAMKTDSGRVEIIG